MRRAILPWTNIGIPTVLIWQSKASPAPTDGVYGKMAHSERRGDAVAKNISGEQDMKIFESGVKYFR